MTPAPTPARLLPPAILLAALLIFFGDVILGGRVLSPADMVFETPFFASHAPPGFERASNALLSDQAYQFTPWRRVTWEALRAGRLPLWDPHSLAGRPILATQQSAVFSPLAWPLLALPYEQTLLWGAVLRLWVAGAGMYLLGRHYRLGRAASLVGALAFMLCGFMVAWLGHPHSAAAAWLPALALAADRLVLAEGRRATARAVALLALVNAAQLAGGHLQTSIDMLFGVGLYTLLRWWSAVARGPLPAWQKAARLLLYPGLALGLGFLAAAPQLAPFAEWLPLSEVLGARSAGGFQPGGAGLWRQAAPAALLAFPNLFGNPTWSAQYLTTVPGQNYSEEALYLGAIPLLLAAYAVAVRWRREPLVWIWAAVALISLGRALRLPPFDLVNQLPGLSLAVSGRMRLVADLALCALAAIGAQALLAGERPERPRLWAGMLAALALAGAALWLWPGAPPTWRDPRVYQPSAVALAGLALALARPRMPKSAHAAALLALAAADLIVLGRGYNPSVAPRDFYPDTPIAARIRQDPGLFRVTAPHADLVPDAQTMLGLSDVRGLDFRTRWYTWYMSAVRGSAGSIYITGFTRLDSPLLRLLNVKYLIASQDAELAADPTLRLVMRDGQVALYEVADPAPRAFMVYEAAAAPSEQAAIDMLRREPGAARRRVVLAAAEGPPPLPPPAGRPTSRVASELYSAEETRWRVATSAEGYLFVSDAYYPGWRAEVDGRPAPIYRADIAFRAVRLPPGEHTVVFRFQPRLVTASLAIGGATTLGLLLALAAASWRRRPTAVLH